MKTEQAQQIAFKAEIQQVLDILIHSLYTEREIFLRELISNASDALNRFKLESLTRKQLVSPSAELAIWLEPDEEAATLTIRDSGIGMTEEEIIQNLGTIAHSGAKGFIEAMKELNEGDSAGTRGMIGQFGVGFYSVFMVADEVTVTSRSYRPEAEAVYWHSSGQDSFEVGSSERTERGTSIEIKLKDDAREFLAGDKLRHVVRTHSNFISYPIYLAEEEGGEKGKQEWRKINEQTALWRERPADITEEQHRSFYQQLTFDSEPPLRTIHLAADVPIQFYALLYIPSRLNYRLLRSQEEYGLKLYARKVLIQQQSKDLLPPYLRFLEGVVDSEDLPLNVSREAIQATPVMARIRSALTGRVASELATLAEEEPQLYRTFYREFGVFLKEGIATDPANQDKFVELLRFPSSKSADADYWVSLAQYRERMKEKQKDIYYLLGDDLSVVAKSAHLEYFRERDLEVLYLTDPVDNLLLMGLTSYQDTPLRNIDDAELLPEESAEAEETALPDDAFAALVAKAKEVLGERVEDVRESKLLRNSPARLVNPAGGAASSIQRVQRLMDNNYQIPQKILELNRSSRLLGELSRRLAVSADDPLVPLIITQLFENQLLMEGLHPNPAEMVPRLQELMMAASEVGEES